MKADRDIHDNFKCENYDFSTNIINRKIHGCLERPGLFLAHAKRMHIKLPGLGADHIRADSFH